VEGSDFQDSMTNTELTVYSGSSTFKLLFSEAKS